MTLRAFITGTGTNVGKTFVTRGVARASMREGNVTCALKPIETGVFDVPLDACALAAACGRAELAQLSGFYRAPEPVSPYAASLLSARPGPDLPQISNHVQRLESDCAVLLVEGAGGLLVPLDAQRTNADLARLLRLPLLLVAQNELGVLSALLTCAESAERRRLPILATVLVDPAVSDPSTPLNRTILSERLNHPVVSFPRCADDDEALADAAIRCGLVDVLVRRTPTANP